MNSFQATSNLVNYLNQANFTWPTTTTPVLGRVAVTVNAPTFNALDQIAPSVLIRPDRSTPHGEHPAEIEEEARWTVTLYVLNATDQAGGAAVVGGNRTSQLKSEGRGLLEIEPLLRAQIYQAFLAAGVRPRITEQPATVPEPLQGLLAARAFLVTATRFPVQPTFSNVTFLLATTTGGATLTWTAPPARWDLVALQVNRATGSTAPATPSSGSVLTSTLSPTATGYVDSGGGTGKSYSVFGVFDETANPFTSARDSSNPISQYSGYGQVDGTFVYEPASASL